MDYHYFKTRLNHLYAHFIDGAKRPTFFDIDTTYPELNTITNAFQLIKAEFEAVIASKKELPKYHEIDPGEHEISNTTDKNWNVFMLYLLGYQLDEARVLCPRLCELLNGIPHLIQAFFSIIEPGKSIPLHEGPYLGYLRYHLGLEVPKNNPPQIIVNNQPYTWQEGEAVLFDDSWPHEVKNTSDGYRAVLIIDVLRPMPIFPRLVNQFVTNVIARYTYGRKTMKRAAEYGTAIQPLHK
jgi:aspartate beta-hydroxylase